MRKIIEGKRYDTETADAIANWDNGYSRDDFKFLDETLYRTKKGAWFLHGEGGALTSYAEHVANHATEGETIIPLSDDRAREWLENHNCVDELEEHFPDSIEDA